MEGEPAGRHAGRRGGESGVPITMSLKRRRARGQGGKQQRKTSVKSQQARPTWSDTMLVLRSPPGLLKKKFKSTKENILVLAVFHCGPLQSAQGRIEGVFGIAFILYMGVELLKKDGPRSLLALLQKTVAETEQGTASRRLNCFLFSFSPSL